MLDLQTGARCDRDTALRCRSENHRGAKVRHWVDRGSVVTFATDGRIAVAARRSVNAGVLVEVVVSTEVFAAVLVRTLVRYRKWVRQSYGRGRQVQ